MRSNDFVMASPQATMHAVQYSKFGDGASALEHVEVPAPVPAKDQVLVKVEAASVNSHNGTGFGGEVVALGPGVTSFAIGDKVCCCNFLAMGGAYAECAVSPIQRTVKLPWNVSASDGASFGIAGQSALQSVRDSAGIKLDGSSKLARHSYLGRCGNLCGSVNFFERKENGFGA